MSSHHVVRDKQEPGVFILNWEKDTGSLLSHLCQWSPVIAVSDNCLDAFLAQGLKINVLLSDNAQIKEELAFQLPFIVLPKTNTPVKDLETHIMDIFHVIGCYPWQQENNEKHVFYTNQKRYAKLTHSPSVWLSENEMLEIYNLAGEKIKEIQGENALINLQEFTQHWVARNF